MQCKLWILGILVVAVLGCAPGGDHPRTYPVRITVLRDGQPVPAANVNLSPVEPGSPYSAYGVTDDQGVCVPTSFRQGDGAVPGEYRVSVRKVEVETRPAPTESDPNGVEPIGERDIVPKKYNNFETSGLTLTVAPQGDNSVTFNVD